MTDVKSQTITITIDGRTVECRPGELLIEVAKRAGVYIPYFCYHPRMDPVGACRMCLIHMQPGPPKPQTACTTRVTDGMTVQTQFTNPDIRDAQQGVLEFLLINHPLDCPICDRGGECPLQDQTQDYGPSESRYVEAKRRFEKPVAISPLVKLDRERCILCYRCTRFCEELSGDVLIGVMERGPEAFIFPFYSFGRDGDGHGDGNGDGHGAVRGPSAGDIDRVFDSYFSGNTVQICPVGALTSTEYRFMSRPWDLQVVQTTCDMCAAGCALNASVRVQDGNVVRFSAAVDERTNEEWLCDKGRFGSAYISSPERLTYPYARKGSELVPVTWAEAFDVLAERFGPVLDGAPSAMLVGESLCDEDSYAAQKFARLVMRTNNVDHRLEGGLSADALIKPEITYDDVLSSDLVVLVACDLREELPVLFLRLRVAATKRGTRFAIVHQREVALSEFASARLAPPPGGEAACGAELAGLLGGGSSEDGDVRRFADALLSAQRPVVLLGSRAHDRSTLSAWRAVADAIGARLSWLPRRSGTYGALASGAHPGLLPGWRSLEAGRADVESAWGAEVPREPGKDAGEILAAAAAGELSALWLVGADVLADVPDGTLGRRALEATPFVVVQDVQSTQLMNHAHLVLPAAAFVEREGTLTDWEGRRQPVSAATDPPGAARADYAILAEAARRLGRPIGCRTSEDVSSELDALIASGPPTVPPPAAAPAPQAPAAELRLLTYRLLYDAGTRVEKTNGIGELTSAPFAEMSSSDAQRLGIADGQEVSVTSAHGSVRLPARVTDRIAPGCVFVPYNQPGGGAQALCAIGDTTPAVIVEAQR